MSNHAINDCPDVNELKSFGLGLLNGDAALEVEADVTHCTECCRTLQGVGRDTLTDLVRAANPPAELADSPTMAFDSAASLDVTHGSAADEIENCPLALRDHPRYRVLAFLGKGGMGAVFKAEHKMMGRPVAIKVLRETLTCKPETIERFRREVKAAARLAHPNIVAAHDAEQAGDTHFLVMEFVEGTDLARYVAERGPLPVAEACDAVRQAARGLQHAHERGMVHRDVKPHNLMRTPTGAIKILDFGLARLVSEVGTTDDGKTAEGVVMGTVNFMAPEQADSAHDADVRSDIYSLGCTLYFLLAGRPPFPGGTLVQKVMAHAGRAPTPLDELRADLPPGLHEVLHMMMAKAPARRYQTPDQVDSALVPFASTRFAGKANLLIGTGRVANQKIGLPGGSHASRRGWHRPASWAVVLLGALGLAAAATVVYRIQTENGELVLSTDNPDVEVIVRKAGKEVTILDARTKQEVTLNAGTYDLELNGRSDGLKLDPVQVTIRRGDLVLATVTRTQKPSAVAPNVDQLGKSGVLYRIGWQDEQQHMPANIYQTGISSDGKLFFGAGDSGLTGVIRVWEVATGQQVQELVPGGPA